MDVSESLAPMVSSQEGQRAAVRNRQAVRTGLAGVLASGVGIAARLVAIPLSLKLLGPERYGVWLAASALVGWGGLADLGIGSGLVNAIGASSGRQEVGAMRRHTSTAAVSLALLSVGVLVAFLGFSQWSGLGSVMGVTGDAALLSDARLLWLLAGISFAGGFALSWVGPLCLGLQEGYLASIAPIGGSLLSLAGLAALAWQGGNVLAVGLVMSAPPVLAMGVLAVVLVTGRHRNLRPSWRLWSRDSVRQIMRVGAPLFLLQLSDLAILNSANILIANRLGPAEVPRYAVPVALFSVAARVCYLMGVPFWPAYAEAAARGDWAWVRTTARRMLGLAALVMGTAGLLIMVWGVTLIRWWAGEAAVPPAPLLAWMAAYHVLTVCSATNGILLNGLGRVAVRTCLRLPVGLAHVAGGWLLLPILGLAAIPLAGGLGFLVDCAVLVPYAFWHVRKAVGERVPIPGSGAPEDVTAHA